MIGRCGWVGEDDVYKSYHDNEWVIPTKIAALFGISWKARR
ncbi:MAG: hypothetical protein AAGK67_17365 [Pseudomonadota bacterium]